MKRRKKRILTREKELHSRLSVPSLRLFWSNGPVYTSNGLRKGRGTRGGETTTLTDSSGLYQRKEETGKVTRPTDPEGTGGGWDWKVGTQMEPKRDKSE